MSVAEITIWKAARLILQRHGPYAEFTATRRATDAMQNGDAAGLSTWTRVLTAIRELQRLERRDGDPLH